MENYHKFSIKGLEKFLADGEKPERLIFERHVYPYWRGYNRAAVGESIEGELVMITSHAGVANATERYMRIGDVHDGVVDADSAG